MSNHAAIEEIAAYWLMRQHEPDWTEADQIGMDEWIEESSAHAAAYWRLEHGYAQFDRLRSLPAAIPISTSRRFRESGWVRLMAASLVLVAFLGIAFMSSDRIFGPPDATVFSTEAGQVANIEMPDGSTVYLDSASQISVAVDDSQRIIHLDHGNAFLDIMRDESRPLYVEAGPARISVLGTEFLVTRNAGLTSVSVLSGMVRLEPDREKPANFVLLEAGDVGKTDGRSVTVGSSTMADLSRRIAWREGKVIFENDRLADAVEQFNKYNDRKIVLADDAAGEMRIGGTFRLGNVRGFTRLLKENYDLKVEEADDEIVISD